MPPFNHSLWGPDADPLVRGNASACVRARASTRVCTFAVCSNASHVLHHISEREHGKDAESGWLWCCSGKAAGGTASKNGKKPEQDAKA